MLAFSFCTDDGAQVLARRCNLWNKNEFIFEHSELEVPVGHPSSYVQKDM